MSDININEQATPQAVNVKKKSVIGRLIPIILILSIVANAVLLVLFYFEREAVQELSGKYSEEYFHYNSITVETFEEMVASGEDFAVIVTRPNCSSCEAVYEEVMALTEEMGINDKIYLLNVYYHRQDADVWNEFKETYGFTGTPNYARFTDGVMVSKAGWVPADSGEEPVDTKTWLEAQADLWEKS